MPAASHVRDPALVGPIGSMALSSVRPLSGSLALRAVRWHAGLVRIGLVLPFMLVHDVGLLLSSPREQLYLGARIDPSALASHLPNVASLVSAYGRLIAELAECEAARRADRLKMSDELVTVVLARLLGHVSARGPARAPSPATIPMDATLFDQSDGEIVTLFRAAPRSFEADSLSALESARLYVLTLADTLDVDTLRLFGILGSEAAGPLAEVSLLAALESPEANDIVNFSLEILPGVLETKTHPAAGESVSLGYSGIGTRGSIDNLVLTELAWDDGELTRRLLDSEVLYYAREQSRDEERRIHHLLIDASASMRGDRQTFARGMAIATGKKLLLMGEDVAFRFFDSRLYEVVRARGGKLPVAHLLSFRGEHGRNPARVFSELAADLDLARRRDPRSPVVHLFTHAALFIPREIVQAVRAHAPIAAVFMLPSGKALNLDYLDLLTEHWFVDHQSLARQSRARIARSILDTQASPARLAPDAGRDDRPGGSPTFE